jgi:hypothetical protein
MAKRTKSVEKKSKKTVKTAKKSPARAKAPKVEKKKRGDLNLPPAPKAKRQFLSLAAPFDSLNPTAKKLIKRLDELEVEILDKGDELQRSLSELAQAVGGCSFVHPDRGAMTIMNRQGKWFWRTKPNGGKPEE